MMPRQGTIVADRYRLERKVGGGRVSAMWLVQDQVTAAACAIKLLHRSMNDHPEALARFSLEDRLSRELNGAYFPERVGSGSWHSLRYIAWRWYEGDCLRSLFERNPKQDVQTVYSIVQETCQALTAVHAAGYTHGDLKPENLFFAECADKESSRQLKLLGFGVASRLARPLLGSQARRTPGQIVGTPLYLSPDLILGRVPRGGTADLWALAVIVYEALTGRAPFLGTDLAELLQVILERQAPRPSSVTNNLPGTFDLWWSQALDQQFATPAEFSSSLARALAPALRSSRTQRSAAMPDRSAPVAEAFARRPSNGAAPSRAEADTFRGGTPTPAGGVTSLGMGPGVSLGVSPTVSPGVELTPLLAAVSSKVVSPQPAAADALKADAPKADALKAASLKPAAFKPDALKADAQKPAPSAASPKTVAPRAAASRGESTKAASTPSVSPKLESPKLESPKLRAGKAAAAPAAARGSEGSAPRTAARADQGTTAPGLMAPAAGAGVSAAGASAGSPSAASPSAASATAAAEPLARGVTSNTVAGIGPAALSMMRALETAAAGATAKIRVMAPGPGASGGASAVSPTDAERTPEAPSPSLPGEARGFSLSDAGSLSDTASRPDTGYLSDTFAPLPSPLRDLGVGTRKTLVGIIPPAVSRASAPAAPATGATPESIAALLPNATLRPKPAASLAIAGTPCKSIDEDDEAFEPPSLASLRRLGSPTVPFPRPRAASRASAPDASEPGSERGHAIPLHANPLHNWQQRTSNTLRIVLTDPDHRPHLVAGLLVCAAAALVIFVSGRSPVAGTGALVEKTGALSGSPQSPQPPPASPRAAGSPGERAAGSPGAERSSGSERALALENAGEPAAGGSSVSGSPVSGGPGADSPAPGGYGRAAGGSALGSLEDGTRGAALVEAPGAPTADAKGALPGRELAPGLVVPSAPGPNTARPHVLEKPRSASPSPLPPTRVDGAQQAEPLRREPAPGAPPPRAIPKKPTDPVPAPRPANGDFDFGI